MTLGTYIHCWAIQQQAQQTFYVGSFLDEDNEFVVVWTEDPDVARSFFHMTSAADKMEILLRHGYDVVLKPVVKEANYGYE